MDFKSFSELREFIRRYNSTSVLQVGTERCWQKWGINYSNPLDWLNDNIERNYAVRLMLLASAGNPHRRENISVQEFDNLINAYHNWKGHTISDKHILEEEAKILSSSILQWELDNKKAVRNWSLKLSSILDLEVIRAHIASLFVQRMGAFQNAGFGHPASRIERTIRLTELLDNLSNKEFSDKFSTHIGLTPANYFSQFLTCLGIFGWFFERRGFCDFSQLPSIYDQLQKSGITPENLKVFIRRNSALFSAQTDTSFRKKISQTLNNVPDFYQPLFYNSFLEVPFINSPDSFRQR